MEDPPKPLFLILTYRSYIKKRNGLLVLHLSLPPPLSISPPPLPGKEKKISNYCVVSFLCRWYHSRRSISCFLLGYATVSIEKKEKKFDKNIQNNNMKISSSKMVRVWVEKWLKTTSSEFFLLLDCFPCFFNLWKIQWTVSCDDWEENKKKKISFLSKKNCSLNLSRPLSS